MIELDNDGVTQKTMARLVNVSPSVISRYISSRNIQPIISAGGRQRNLKYTIEDARNIIKNLLSIKEPLKSKKHIFYNFKGGTGKTSICFQVASHFALLGFRVLAIDADPQAHLSSSIGFSNDNQAYTLYDVIVTKKRLSDVIKPIYPGLDCIPSNLSLSKLEVELNNMPKREERLAMELGELEHEYDFIFIDTNPTISILNRNIINFTDVIHIVCETQPYSLNGLKILMEDLARFFDQMRMPAKEINIIPNKYEDRSTNSAEAMTALRTYYSEYIKEDFAVRKSEDITTSAKIGKPLALFAKKNSIALEDVIELTHYILSKFSLGK